MSGYAGTLFIIIILLSLFTFFQRADYNLPLFAFSYFLWDHSRPSQRTRIWYMILFSMIIDFVWIGFWATFWNHEDFKINNPSRITSMTVLVSVIELVIKLFVLIYLFVSEPECRIAMRNIGANFKSVFVWTPEEYQQA